AGMLLEVQLPHGGTVPIGHAVVMAAAWALPSAKYALVVALGLLLCYPVLVRRVAVRSAGRVVARWCLAAAGAGAAVAAVRAALPATVDPSTPKVALLGLLAGGIAYLV